MLLESATMNKESKLRYNRDWKRKNRAKTRASYKEYYQRNRAAILARHTANRRAAGAVELDYRRRLYFKRKYGVTPEQRDEMIAAQAGKCAICSMPFGPRHTDTHLDHCHKSGLVRGILCRECNTGMGMMNDDPAVLQAALDYLQRHHPVLTAKG